MCVRACVGVWGVCVRVCEFVFARVYVYMCVGVCGGVGVCMCVLYVR